MYTQIGNLISFFYNVDCNSRIKSIIQSMILYRIMLIVDGQPYTTQHNIRGMRSTHPITVSYDEIKQKVNTQGNDYHRLKAYTP